MVGLVTIGADVPGFASKGDLVWIVRSVGHDFMVQEVWVSSTTGKATCVLPIGGGRAKGKGRRKGAIHQIQVKEDEREGCT